MKEDYGTLGIPSGRFGTGRSPKRDGKRSRRRPATSRHYVGLRNRLSILDENYVHADFKIRVLGNYFFLRAIVDYTTSMRLVRLVAEADRRTVARGMAPDSEDSVAVEYEAKALPSRSRSTDTRQRSSKDRGPPRAEEDGPEEVFTVPYYADYQIKRGVRFPFAYLLPAADAEVVRKLLQHGIAVEARRISVEIRGPDLLP